MNVTFVAALLTILGYSVNDTIVVLIAFVKISLPLLENLHQR